MCKANRVLVIVVLLSLFLSALPVRALTPSPLLPSPSPAEREREKGVAAGRGVEVRAAGRGNPWINLLDGETVSTTYRGAEALVQVLATARPLALTSDDFDEDGMPDLIAGYAAGDGGLVALHFGSIDYLWPDGPEAEARRAAGLFVDAPFLPEARLFALPAVPDFLGAGDFDNDGHRDVVAAARGGAALYLLPGDGRGGFGAPEVVPLPGAVTAFAAGEVNRRDGLQDLVVGVDVGADGRPPLLVVFEGPTGALRWEPETIPLPVAAAAIAIGQMDDHYCMDIAAAGGNTLMLVHGRDRQLSVGAAAAAVPAAVVDRRALPYAVTALALGDFVPEEGYTKELALLAADGVAHFLTPAGGEEVASYALPLGTAAIQHPTSQLVTINTCGLPGDSLAVLDAASRQVHLVAALDRETVPDDQGGRNAVVRPWSVALDAAGVPTALLPMRLNPDALNDLVVLQEESGTPVVVATAPLSTYTVNSTGDEPDPYLYDDLCDICHDPEANPPVPPCGICTFPAAARQAAISPGPNQIDFALSSGTPTIIHYGAYYIDTGWDTTVLGNTGGATRVELRFEAYGNAHLELGMRTVVRAMVVNGNGNSQVLMQYDDNILEGSMVGIDASGASDSYEWDALGVSINNHNNVVGGTVAAARNIISSNWNGVVSYGTGNLVQGNYVGTDMSGLHPLGNRYIGVGLGGSSCQNSTVGGTAPGAGNVIADNGSGVEGEFDKGSLIQGNWIGPDRYGRPLGNHGSGIVLENSSAATIGGTAAGAGNVIAYNSSDNARGGIYLQQSAPLIRRNRIYDNVGPGINSVATGPTLNPIVLAGGQMVVSGFSSAAPPCEVELFANDACDPSGYGEGQHYLGTVALSDTYYFSVTLPLRGRAVAATASSGSTSRFSNCAAVPLYKIAEPDRVTFRRPITYTVGVTNTAGEPLPVTIADPLPAGTAFVAGSLWSSQGTPVFDGSRVTWDGALDPGVELQVRFQVSTTCDAPTLIVNQATVTQDGTPYTLEAETERYEPEYLDIAAGTPSPAAGAKEILIEPPPALSWSGAGQCGMNPAAGDQVAYRVYVKPAGGAWQEVGAYPNCGRSVALPAGTLQCGPDGDPHPYTWKVEAVDIQNPCRDPVVRAWGFETASCRPAVTVKPQFEKYFLTGLEVENLYRAEVDWNGPARQGNGEALKQEVRFDLNGTEVVEAGQDWGAGHTYNMGQDMRASLLGGLNVLRIRAVNSEGYASEVAALQPQVFPLPAWIQELPMGDFEIDLEAMTVKYARALEYPDPHFEARYQVPGWVPYLGGADMGIIETFAAVGAEACSDGSGAVEVSGNTGVQLTEEAQVTGKLYGKGEVQLGPPAGLDLVGATFGLEIAGRIAKEMGVADLIPAVKAAESWPIVGRLVRWFNERAQVEGAVEPQMQIETHFKDVEDHLVFDSGSGTGKIKMMLTLSLEVFDWLKAAIFGGGEPRVVVQVPSAPPWGYLKEIAIRLFAGLRLTVWRFEGEWERGVTCSLPTAGCQSDDGEGLLSPGWRLLGREYVGPGYAAFAGRATVNAAGEEPLVLDVFPLADPALAARDDGARVVLYVHDDVSNPIGQGEEIRAAHWNGAAWTPATVTDDLLQDFHPQVAYDAQGDAVALWERSNTVWFSPTLTITYARSFEIATAEWDPALGWSGVVTLTHDGRMDVTPQLAQGGDGTLLALWRTSDGFDFLGTVTHPLTLTYALWDGTAWSAPTAALDGLAHVLDVDVAVYSVTQAALVLARDGDGDLGSGADTELAYATWDGAAWSALLPLTTDAITDSRPSLAYDPTGQPLVVWLRAGDLVQQVGWAGTPTIIRSASTSGAFLDFDLASAADGNLALVWQALGPAGADAAYSVYDPLHASWGADNTLMADTALDESFAPVLTADALAMAYQKVTIEFVTLTYDISPTLTITVPNVPQPVQTDLYFLEHAIGYDLAAGAVVVAPPNPAPGASALITATVRNAGDLAVVGGQVAFYDGDPGAGGTLIGITQTLPGVFRAATTATVSVAWNVPAGDVPHTLYVVADPANALAEGDETNNVATLATVRPDLAVAWAHSGHSPSAITLTAVVANRGVTSAQGPFAVAFRAADPLTGTLLGTVEVTPTVPPGAVVTATLALTEPAGLAGLGRRFWAIADAGQTIAEGDETNNTGYGALDARPDLTLDASDIAGEGPIVVTVRNAGVVTATEVALIVWSGSFSGTVVYSGTVGTIPPGGSAAATFDLPAGRYELWALADPHRAIVESDESNNLAIRERATWNRVYLPLVVRNR